MTDYRKANAINLVVGVALILLGLGGIAGLATSNVLGANLFWSMIFVLFFVLMGGYETGKYGEMRHERERATRNFA